jgi:hypothetical protein
MKRNSPRIFGILFGLGLLWIIVPYARSDDATDWLAQAQRDREQAQKEREDWYKQQDQAQKDRDEWQRLQAWQEAANQAPLRVPAAAGPKVVPPNPPLAIKVAAPARPVLRPQPGEKTLTITIYNGSQVTRTTYAMRDGF